MSLIRLSLRRKRSIQASSAGLAMSRGPTGSRWAVDAGGNDGVFPAMPFPTYGTTAATSFTQYAQAADFYNSVGINVHPYYPSINFDNATERATIINRIVELGIRNVRGLGLTHPGETTREDFMDKAQQWHVECIQRSLTRSLTTGGPAGTGEQPLFNTAGISDPRNKGSAQDFGPKFQYEIVDADGTGMNIFWPITAGNPPAPIPLASSPAPGSYGQVTSGTNQHHSGPIYSRNKTLTSAHPPLGWDGFESMMGPNERREWMGIGFDYGMAWLGQEMMRYKRLPSLANTTILFGEDYIDYNTGRITPGPAKMPQLPVCGFAHGLGQFYVQAEDYTLRTLGDVTSFHQYWSGCPPQWDDNWGKRPNDPNDPDQNHWYPNGGTWRTLNCVNGVTKTGTGTRNSRSIPQWMTEMGWYQWPQAYGTIAGSTPNTNIGLYQYAPPHISGEFLIQNLVINYCQGIKRSHIYKITHEGFDKAVGYNLNSNSFPGALPAMGLCLTDGTRTESFYAIKNLMGMVGWRQGPDEGPQPIQIPHTYTERTGLIWCDRRETYNTGLPNNGTTSLNASDYATRDCCYKLVLRCSADEMLVIFCRPSVIWGRRDYFDSRSAGNSHATALAAGQKTETDTRNVTFQIPSGWTAVGVAEPAKNPILDPTVADSGGGDSLNYSNPNNGTAFAAPSAGTDSTAAPYFAVSGTTATLRMCALTRVVKLQRSTPVPTTLPIVVPSVGSTPAALRTGSVNGPRLHLKGINVWGLPDNITNNVSISGTAFHQHQYAGRATVCDTANDWGANCVRLRAQASDYNGAPSANTDSLTKTQILDRIEDWRDACVAEGMYLVICPWDALDGPYSGSAFPAQYTNTFQFYTDVYGRLGDDPMVMYETPNEPNNISMAQWQTVMQGYLSHFRDTLGYTGVLVLEPPNWSNSGGSTSSTGNPAGYSDATYSALEAFDGARSGMGGKHQLIFAKHDYANNSGYGGTFSQTNWVNGMGGSDIKHLIWANEFGNYNAGGPDPDTVAQWSVDYAIAARDRFTAKQNYVGAAPFLFGPWSDANRLTDADNVTATAAPTGWGPTARDYYFGTSNPPPTSLFTPGTVSNGSTSFDANAALGAVSLGSKIARVEQVISTNPTTFDDDMTYYADRNIKILLLLAIGNPTIVSQAAVENAGAWATRFGPGGTFWSTYGGTDRPITHFEFGNETNFNWQQPAGQTDGTPAYIAKAGLYAQRFQQAYNAIQAANPAVGLLCQGTPNDSGTASWVNGMFAAVPGLAAMVSGWTLHPYTPDWLNRVNTAVSHLSNRDPNKPLDFTEIGISTDNGRSLNNNYNWPVNLTYSQAATSLQGVITGMHQAAWWPRVRHWMYYQAHDNQATGVSVDREAYFGALQSNLAEKGAYSTQVRTIMAMTS